MKLRDYKEKEFIKEILSSYAVTASPEQFDDCVVVDLAEICGVPELPYLVYSIDHPSFIRRGLGEEMDHRFYGRWVAAAVCGDVLAMGTRPRGFSLDLAVPNEMESEAVEWIFQGLRDVLDTYGTTLEGGNLDSNALELVGYAWGLVPRDQIIRRSGAREGDYIVVTGVLGFGWADWALRKLGRFDELSADTQQAFREYKLMPLAPHVPMLASFATRGITSGMDLTDGIVEFLYTIHERNDLGVCLEEDSLPVTPEMSEAAGLLGVRPALLALEAGYDTPLTHGWTVKPEAWPAVQAAFQSEGKPIHRIGYVTAEPDILLATSRGRRAVGRFWDDQFQKDHIIERWYEFVKGL